MIPFIFRFFPIVTKNAFKFSSIVRFPIFQNKSTFLFCDSRRHDTPDPDYQGPKAQRGGSGSQSRSTGESQPIKRQGRHKHGSGCKHDHGHHHDRHHHGAPFQKPHHPPNDSPPNVKLSKLSFEQLIQIKSEDALRYAQMIYQQEETSLKELVQAKEEGMRFMQFFKKTEHEIKEKERRITENIEDYESEIVLSERRAYKQIEESKLSAVTQLAREFIEVADCVSSCRKMAEMASPADPYIQRIFQAEQLIRDIMARYGIEEFDPTDQPFDPHYQESLSQLPTPLGARTGYVAKTLQTGYRMHGRLLRSARVAVFV